MPRSTPSKASVASVLVPSLRLGAPEGRTAAKAATPLRQSALPRIQGLLHSANRGSTCPTGRPGCQTAMRIRLSAPGPAGPRAAVPRRGRRARPAAVSGDPGAGRGAARRDAHATGPGGIGHAGQREKGHGGVSGGAGRGRRAAADAAAALRRPRGGRHARRAGRGDAADGRGRQRARGGGGVAPAVWRRPNATRRGARRRSMPARQVIPTWPSGSTPWWTRRRRSGERERLVAAAPRARDRPFAWVRPAVGRSCASARLAEGVTRRPRHGLEGG